MEVVSFASTMANPITLLFLFFFVLFLLIGAFVFSKDTKSIENRFFLILCISFSFVCFGEIFFSWSPIKEDAYFFHAVSSIGFFTFWPIVLNFFILFRNKKVGKPWLIFLIISYAISIAYIYMVFAGINVSKDYIRDTYTWIDVITDSFWYSKVYLPFVFIPWVILVFYNIFKIRSNAKKTGDIIRRRQFNIIWFSGIIMFFYGFVVSVLFPVLGLKIPAVGHFSTGFWIFFVGYAITKYKFLVPTLEYASKEIFKIGGEINIVTDMSLNITEVNDIFFRKLGYLKDQIKSSNFNDLLFKDEVYIDIEILNEEKVNEREISLKKKNGERIYTNLKASFIYNNKIKIGILFVLSDITLLKNQNEILEQKVKERTKELMEEQAESDRLINVLANGSEVKSVDQKSHRERVADFSVFILKNLFPEYLSSDIIYYAASLHDVGKIYVSDSISNKPGKLDEKETLEMRKHTEHGYDIFKEFKREKFRVAALVTSQHHERWDGTGYPLGLKEENISLEARIVSVADSLDAILSPRVYKAALTKEEAKTKISLDSGKAFDPIVAGFVVDNFDSFFEMWNKYNN